MNPIEEQSFAILSDRVDLSTWPSGARDVVARMIHATADESFASSARIGACAVERAVRALAGESIVICDVNMVLAGVPSVRSAVCYLDRVPKDAFDGLSESSAQAGDGLTRTAAAFELAAAEHPTGALWVVGNAPTALVRLMELHAAGEVAPAAVVGLPVGYVGAAESKQALWDSGLREVAITNEGPRGGSPVAAAAVNALARLAGV